MNSSSARTKWRLKGLTLGSVLLLLVFVLPALLVVLGLGPV